MFLSQFHQDDANGIHVSTEQASRFAKEVAGDFNPLHNPDAKRFCVPGDLLFALVLEKYGLSQQMCFTFAGMVGRGVALRFPASDGEEVAIVDDKGKTYLRVDRRGGVAEQEELVESFTRQYVSFSGHSFPDVLVPLLKERNVMLNPDRPLVIYESMSIHLDHLDLIDPVLKTTASSLEVKGKRGDVRLEFQIEAAGEVVGAGFKKMVLSGLREYEEDKVQSLIEDYNASKQTYRTGGAGS